MTTASSSAIRLLVVDDHMLFRESLCRMLEAERGVTIAGDYSTAASALAALRDGLAFDAALIDYDLGMSEESELSGLDLVEQLRLLVPDARVLMVTAGIDIPELRHAIGGLRVGVFLKTEPTAELLLAIHRTARGEQWISSRASLALLAEQATSQAQSLERSALSERESSVLQLVLEGKSNKEIGGEIGATESSIKAVLQKLFEKAGVRNRSQLVRYAIESHIESRGPHRG